MFCCVLLFDLCISRCSCVLVWKVSVDIGMVVLLF